MKNRAICESCGAKGPLVGLNGRWLCLACFDEGMQKIGTFVQDLRKQFNQVQRS